MAIISHDKWDTQKGTKDAARHQKKIDKAIREQVKNVIGEESIITTEGGRKVKVPVKGMKDYRFIYGGKTTGGVGQGDSGAGDTIYERDVGGGGQSGQGGQGGGEEFIEAEVDIDYLIEVMFEDLGLPLLDEKKKNTIEVPKGWKLNSISKIGPHSRIHKMRSMKEAIKQNIGHQAVISKHTGCSIEDAQKALIQAKGDVKEAINILENGILILDGDSNIIIYDENLRYKQIEEDIEICSNAVVIAMMDISGSMDGEKKYLCRSLLFWMVQFLKKQYEHVEIRFIAHTDTASEVDEDTFFRKASYGGTQSVTAWEKANRMIDLEYPIDEWNVYAFYCSDGDDWGPLQTVEEIEKTVAKKVNMVSYIEVDPIDSGWSSDGSESLLMQQIKKKWKFEGSDDFALNKEHHLLLSLIKEKKQIWPCLKFMLGLDLEERIST